MDSRRSSRKLTLARQRELSIAAAVAQQEIMHFHVASALRLIDLAAGRVSVIRMIEIYVRLHGVTGSMAELLSNSVLATLGQHATPDTIDNLVVDNEDVVAADPRSLLGLLRLRVRGRVHHDLRRTVELAFGAAQVGLLDLHVHHALRFAHYLTGTYDTARAVELYADMTGVRQPTWDVLYVHVLDRLAHEELPSQEPVQEPSADEQAPKRRPSAIAVA